MPVDLKDSEVTRDSLSRTFTTSTHICRRNVRTMPDGLYVRLCHAFLVFSSFSLLPSDMVPFIVFMDV